MGDFIKKQSVETNKAKQIKLENMMPYPLKESENYKQKNQRLGILWKNL